MDILATKLYIPDPNILAVPRPQLNARFEEAVAGSVRLILLTAPAGFGKTTLLTQWLKTQDRPVGWLSLDKGEQHVSRFLVYLVHALQEIHPEVGKKLLIILRDADSPPVENILAAIINDVVQHVDEGVLVLDDYQAAENARIDEIVSYLLENLPQNLTLVITTRVYPDLSLSRLRVQGQLLEIRVEDLRFSTDEVRHFLNQNLRLSLSADQLRVLHKQTEGWAAGLQLAALSLEREPDQEKFIEEFSGSNRYITDYLAEEVLRRQPPDVQRFLLVTSITDRMCAGLCDALLGTSDSADVLSYLESHNLFVVPLDYDRTWYRYHHLFADLLQQRFRQSNPENYAQAFRTASQWCLTEGLEEEAVSYAFASDDMVFAAQTLTPLVARLTSTGRSRNVQEWMNQLPEDVIEQHASLCLYFAISSILQRDFERVEQLLDAAERAPQGVPVGYTELARVLYDSVMYDGENALDRAYRALKDLPDSATFQRSVLWLIISTRGLTVNDLALAEQAGEEALTVRGEIEDTRGLVTIYHNLAYASLGLTGVGSAQQWIDELDEHRRRYEESFGLPIAGTEYLLGMKAWVAYEQNALAEAEQYCLEALDALAVTGEPYNPAIRDVYLTLVRIAVSNGDLDRAQAWHDSAMNLIRTTYVAGFSHQLMEQGQVEIWLADGNDYEIERWAAQHSFSTVTDIASNTEEQMLLYGRWLVANQDDSVIPILEDLMETAKAGSRQRSVLRALTLHALALHHADQDDSALRIFAEALETARRGSYIRSMLDMGRGVVDLLKLTKERPEASPYCDVLLSSVDSVQAPPDTLTPREMEILELIAQGRSNNAIATDLVIAPGTVKRHTANIYEKLYVGSRTEAVARAREQGLLT